MPWTNSTCGQAAGHAGFDSGFDSLGALFATCGFLRRGQVEFISQMEQPCPSLRIVSILTIVGVPCSHPRDWIDPEGD